MNRSRFHIRAVARTGDHRLHTESSKRISVFRLYGVAGLYWLVGETVSRTHEVAGKFCFQHFDLSKPLDGSRPHPTGNESEGGKSVGLGQGGSIHAGGDCGIGNQHYLNVDTVGGCRIIAENVSETT